MNIYGESRELSQQTKKMCRFIEFSDGVKNKISSPSKFCKPQIKDSKFTISQKAYKCRYVVVK